jgi:hypothetical protein
VKQILSSHPSRVLLLMVVNQKKKKTKQKQCLLSSLFTVLEILKDEIKHCWFKLDLNK